MDFYFVLGLERDASLSDIKRAYRRLARKYHPNLNPGDSESEALFRQIVTAYETLIDPDRRREYDSGARDGAHAEQASYAFEGFDFSAAVNRHQGSSFDDLFSEIFRRPSLAAGRPEDGADLHARISLSFEDAMIGAERAVPVTRLERCRACQGAGLVEALEQHCADCGGTGSVRWVRSHMVFSKSCGSCGGSGRQRHRTCSACRGEGVGMHGETIKVRIPVGTRHGMQLRLPGEGNVGRRGGKRGDLYITVEVGTHPLFRREGDDLHIVVPVAVHEAVLGAKIDVPTIDGPTKLRVPPGTQSGQRFRRRGRGAPSPRNGRRGDLVAEIQLVLPRLIDERSKELLREFGRINSENVRRDLGV